MVSDQQQKVEFLGTFNGCNGPAGGGEGATSDEVIIKKHSIRKVV